MASAKKNIPAKPGKKPSSAKRASTPAVRNAGPAKSGGKRKAKAAAPAVKRTSRGTQKLTAKKKPSPKKMVSSVKAKAGTAAEKKKPAVRKAVAPKTTAHRTKKTLPAKAKKPATKTAPAGKRVASQNRTAAVDLSTERLRGLKTMLIAKRNGILKEAKDEMAKYMSGDNRQLVDTAIDEGDWAVIDISEDLSLRRLDSHRQLLLDIDEALRKIQEGTYGLCEECGEEISEKRLQVLPTAILCIDCKENKEKMEALALTPEL